MNEKASGKEVRENLQRMEERLKELHDYL